MRAPSKAPPPRSGGDTADLLARLDRAGPAVLDDRQSLQLAADLTAQEAAALIAEFGSLPEVLAADRAALMRIVPPAAASRLVLAQDLARRLLAAPLAARPVLSSGISVADYLRAVLRGRRREQFRVLFLDRRNRLIRDEVMGQGTLDHCPVYPREIVRRALELDAAGVVLAHNHPGADPAPSTADVEATRQVAEAGRALRITVHDHLLVAGEAVVSLRSLGVLA